MAGVCICSELWRQAHSQEVLSSLSMMLQATNYRLRFSSISPDFILNNAGISIAFVVIEDVKKELTSQASERIAKMKANFQNSYVIVSLTSEDDYSVFANFYFSFSSPADRPAFLPVSSSHMALEKMLRMALCFAVCKREGTTGMVDLERKQFVQSEDAMVSCVTSIPKLQLHDAHSVLQGIGSLEAMSSASKDDILETTDLSVETAESIVRLFNDKEYGSAPKLE